MEGRRGKERKKGIRIRRERKRREERGRNGRKLIKKLKDASRIQKSRYSQECKNILKISLHKLTISKCVV